MNRKSDDPHNTPLQPHSPSEDILDLAIEDILGKDNPSAYSTLTTIERSLRQFHLNSQIEAAEILAEAYLRGKKFLQSGQVINNPHAWLKKTAFNVIRERSRQCRKHRVEPYEEDKISEDPITNFVDIQELESDFADLRQAIKLLAKEDPKGAKLLYLKIIQGFSWQEIHDILLQQNQEVASLATLRQRASRAKKRLRHLFHSVAPPI
jgi:DNA-directed RNA polymerase specialized sigma24 family protein